VTAGAFARVVRQAAVRPRPAGPCCGLCAEPVPDGHRHALDTGDGGLLCVCRACSLLFSRPAASRGHYQLIPQRRARLPGVPLRALGVPVGLAFFVPGSDGRVLAHYPSPAGATQWEVPPEAWQQARRACPALEGLVPQVEALLACTVRGRADVWLLPLDDCYRLTAVVRQHWRGLSGGDRVWPAIEKFLDELREG